jgi:hypothetical protein
VAAGLLCDSCMTIVINSVGYAVVHVLYQSGCCQCAVPLHAATGQLGCSACFDCIMLRQLLAAALWRRVMLPSCQVTWQHDVANIPKITKLSLTGSQSRWQLRCTTHSMLCCLHIQRCRNGLKGCMPCSSAYHMRSAQRCGKELSDSAL